MNTQIKTWVRQYPLPAFFLAAIGFGFAAFIPALWLRPQQEFLPQILVFYLGRLAVFSPVLSAMLVAWIVRPERQPVSRVTQLRIFLLVWLIATIVLAASLRLDASAELTIQQLVWLSLPAALLPAWVIASAFYGPDGVRCLLATLVRPKGKIRYYLFALLAFPVIHFSGVVITNIMAGRAWLPQFEGGGNMVYTFLVSFLAVFFFSGGLNEESGWRGFAQKKLQSRFSPLVANLLLWAPLVIWHIPNDIIQYREGGYLLVRFGLYPFIVVLFGWTYNRTQGSILAPALFHASMNAMNALMGVLPITTAGNILLLGLTLFVVIYDRMWRRLPREHPALHESPAAAIPGLLVA